MSSVRQSFEQDIAAYFRAISSKIVEPRTKNILPKTRDLSVLALSCNKEVFDHR